MWGVFIPILSAILLIGSHDHKIVNFEIVYPNTLIVFSLRPLDLVALENLSGMRFDEMLRIQSHLVSKQLVWFDLIFLTNIKLNKTIIKFIFSLVDDIYLINSLT